MNKRRSFITGLILSAALIIGIAAVAPPITQSRDLRISNTNDTTALIIQKPGNVSSNAIEIRRGGTFEFGIPASNVAARLKVNLGIQTSRCVSTGDGTVTNTFATAFSSAPKVFLTQYGNVITRSNAVTSVTASNCVINTVISGVTNDVLAIGAP